MSSKIEQPFIPIMGDVILDASGTCWMFYRTFPQGVQTFVWRGFNGQEAPQVQDRRVQGPHDHLPWLLLARDGKPTDDGPPAEHLGLQASYVVYSRPEPELKVACETCKAEEGMRCTTKSLRNTKPHEARKDRYRQLRDSLAFAADNADKAHARSTDG